MPEIRSPLLSLPRPTCHSPYYPYREALLTALLAEEVLEVARYRVRGW